MATTTDRTDVIATCSFCGKPNTEVTRIIAGPGVFISDQCVDLCGTVLRDRAERGSAGGGPEGSIEQLEPWELAFDLPTAMATIPRVAAASRQAEDALGRLVRRAHDTGATWASIGEALGITKQSAWERFSGEE